MSRGGYRSGAGRPGWKQTAERSLRIDLREFKRRGLLFEGAAFPWTWSYGGGSHKAGSVDVRIEAHGVSLSYSINGEATRQQIGMTRTRCNFGGHRAWLHCPRCYRRCLLLYFRGDSFKCRTCCRLAYASQSEDRVGRSWRRQQRIEARLGSDMARPKGMHRKTYRRLLAAIQDCEEIRDEELSRLLLNLGLADL